ncbi:MAG: PTS sugar transporter subunit IIA [Calditrichaeota bacterium]|nr:PTS sugar transporter subunit IIA [Calditrichota bacterium]
MVAGILVTHGPVADALIQAATGILGPVEHLAGLSVTGLSLSAIQSRLRSLVHGYAERDGVLIMASLRGGSCWNAAARVAHEVANVRVVSGVNLPMVLSFVTKREHLELNELAQVIANDGTRGITLLPA